MKRPSWEETWMNIVSEMERRSVCLRYKVAAIFVRDNILLSGGYNGPPKGIEHCNEVGCAKEMSGRCRGAHAETNAIVNAALNGTSLHHATLYCSWSPCLECAKHLINLGLIELVYKNKYTKEPEAKKMLEQAGVKLVLLDRTF